MQRLAKHVISFIACLAILAASPFASAQTLTAEVVHPEAMLEHSARDSSAQILFDSANRERAARGLSQLRWDDALARAAGLHVQRMADQYTLSHQFPGESGLAERVRLAGARFVALAENLAEGPSASVLHNEWMNSPAHRENLLDSQLTSLGIAVTVRNGQLFAVEDFSKTVPELSFEQQESQLAAQLRTRGLYLLNEADHTRDARQVCSADHASNLTHPPPFRVRYASIDLGVLPDVLLHELSSGRYHSASVAACESDRHDDYAVYQVAVLLYQ